MAKPASPTATSSAASENQQIKLWARWMKEAEKEQELHGKQRTRAIKFITGEQWGSADESVWGGTRITANYLYPTLKVLLPHLVPRHPRAQILPQRAAENITPTVAGVIEDKLAYNWREGRYLPQIRKCVTEAIISGIGWVRCSWDKERQIPEVKNVRPSHMLVDPEADQDLSEAGWVAEKVTMKIADLKADPFFKNVDELHPETYKSRYGLKDETSGEDRTLERNKDSLSTVDVWFIWSRRGTGLPKARSESEQEEALGNNVLLCYSPGHDFWLHKGPWPLLFDHDEFPFRCLRFNYDPVRFLPYGPFKPALAAQEFLNWQASFLVSHTKKGASSKIIYDKTMVNTDQLSRIFNGVDYEAVAVDFLDGGKTPFHVVDLQTDPSKILETINLARQMIYDITGVAEILMGGQGKTQSATEADIRERRAQNRVDDMNDQVKALINDVNRGITMIDFLMTPAHTNGDDDGIDFFLGSQASEAWQVVEGLTPRQVRSEILFEIDAGTMRRPTREQQLNDLFGLWDRLAPLYMQLQMWDALQRLIDRTIKALELPEPQELIPQKIEPPQMSPEDQQAQAEQQTQMALAEQQKETQLKEAFTQIQQQMELLGQQSQQADGQMQQGLSMVQEGARAELQAALQSFQAALVASGQNAAGDMVGALREEMRSVVGASFQGIQTGATMEQIGTVAQGAAQQIEMVKSQAGEAIAGTVQETQEAVEADLEDAKTPVRFEQVVERDALGRIARVVGSIGGAEPEDGEGLGL